MFTHCRQNRIHHWCSVETGKSQPEGPPFQWTRGLGFFCRHWTSMIDSFSHMLSPNTFKICVHGATIISHRPAVWERFCGQWISTEMIRSFRHWYVRKIKSIPQRCWCEISVAIFEISYMRRLTSWRSKLSDNVGFLRLWRLLVQQRFKTSNAYSSFIWEWKYQVWVYVILVRT